MPSDVPGRLTSRRFDRPVAAAPCALVAGILLTYLASPQTFLAYILEARHREAQLVEIVTVAAAALAAITLLISGTSLWLATVRLPRGSWLPGGALLIVTVGLAALFLAGEELSWGQTIFHWRTPTGLQTVSRETNLHNGRLAFSVHALGNLFLVGALVGAPMLWQFRDRLRLPADWRPGMAEWPVVTTAILAMVIRFPKDVWRWSHTAAENHVSPFYTQYLEEMTEQKEMLVALAMAIYAIYRIQAVRRERAAFLSTSASPPADDAAT